MATWRTAGGPSGLGEKDDHGKTRCDPGCSGWGIRGVCERSEHLRDSAGERRGTARGRAKIKDKQWVWSALTLGAEEEGRGGDCGVGAAAATLSSITLLERSRLPVSGGTTPQ